MKRIIILILAALTSYTFSLNCNVNALALGFENILDERDIFYNSKIQKGETDIIIVLKKESKPKNGVVFQYEYRISPKTCQLIYVDMRILNADSRDTIQTKSAWLRSDYTSVEAYGTLIAICRDRAEFIGGLFENKRCQCYNKKNQPTTASSCLDEHEYEFFKTYVGLEIKEIKKKKETIKKTMNASIRQMLENGEEIREGGIEQIELIE